MMANLCLLRGAGRAQSGRPRPAVLRHFLKQRAVRLWSRFRSQIAGRERCDSDARWDELQPAYENLAAKVGWRPGAGAEHAVRQVLTVAARGSLGQPVRNLGQVTLPG
jgi:hypothetical protein